ncbi:phospholipid-binding protein MlaC [Thalassotalea euphylliae]|uniref:MlaC/ttg2D family ABC transporter substrate-binding protein n=1 Tax=Thalassotalea euphylliae TaxID=1655234 RepID=UPI00362C3D5F
MFRKILFMSAILFQLSSAQAETVSPYKVLENTGKGLFTRIAANQQELAKFPELMRTIVEEELMPHVDYQYAAYKILGKHIKKTTAEERKNFVKSMRHYLIRTYANALTKYTDQKVIYEQEKPTNGKKVVAISTRIVDKNAPEIELQFKMRIHKKSGQWKAYDMVVEGISLLQSKKAELSRKIQQQGVAQVSLELASIAK